MIFSVTWRHQQALGLDLPRVHVVHQMKRRSGIRRNSQYVRQAHFFRFIGDTGPLHICNIFGTAPNRDLNCNRYKIPSSSHQRQRPYRDMLAPENRFSEVMPFRAWISSLHSAFNLQARAGCCGGVSITVSTSTLGIDEPVPARFVAEALGFFV